MSRTSASPQFGSVSPREGVVRKRALMVERVRGPLSTLTTGVQALGCEVARAADAQSAARIAESQRDLCFVTINGEALSGDVAWLTNKLKAQHPDLPIFL